MSTLAKVKKGETVMLCVFTGMKIGPKEVVACDKSTITIHHNGKGDMVFNRKDGKLIKPLPNNPKFASFIMEDDGTFVRPTRKGSKNKVVKRAKVEPVRDDDEFDEDEVEEEEEPAPKKRSKKPEPKKAKKKKPEPEPEPEDDDDEWDDDFEEVE